MTIERIQNGIEVVERETFPLSALDERKDVPLGRLVRYWFSLPRHHGTLPEIDSIGLLEMARLGALGWFHIVNVGNEDPANFRYDLFAGRGEGGYSGIRICDIGSKALRRALEQDLVRAKAASFPLFQGVRADLTGHYREYRRIALPFASDSNDVSHLLLGVHFDE